MGIFSSKKNKTTALSWTEIADVSTLDDVFKRSSVHPVLFFKHSKTCLISKMALHRFEKKWEASENCHIYYIDLLAHRDVSNHLADLTAVQHESPQVIVVHNHQVIYNASHNGISIEEIKNRL